jgi:hypothetical protein
MAAFVAEPALASLDAQPPGRPSVRTVETYRVKDQGSCGSYGVIQIGLRDVVDDRTSPEEMGYRIQIESGNAPGPVRAIDGRAQFFGSSSLLIQVGFEEITSTDFTFTVSLVDKAGNVGPPSVSARAVYSGETHDHGGGCSMPRRIPSSALGGLVPLALAWLLTIARRRAR